MSRLSKCIGAAGGLTFDQTVARAENSLALLSGDANAHLKANLERLLQLAHEVMQGDGRKELRAIHHAATEIQSIAGMFGFWRLSDAAKLLSELTMELDQMEKPPLRVMLLFANALLSIFNEGDAAADELVASLGVLSSRVMAGALA